MVTNFKTNSIYYDEGSESTQGNFGKFINQLQPKTQTLVRKLERNLIKLYIQNVFTI